MGNFQDSILTAFTLSYTCLDITHAGLLCADMNAKPLKNNTDQFQRM